MDEKSLHLRLWEEALLCRYSECANNARAGCSYCPGGSPHRRSSCRVTDSLWCRGGFARSAGSPERSDQAARAMESSALVCEDARRVIDAVHVGHQADELVGVRRAARFEYDAGSVQGEYPLRARIRRSRHSAGQQAARPSEENGRGRGMSNEELVRRFADGMKSRRAS